MISTNDLKPGMTIEVDGEPCLVLEAEHHKPVGRGGALVRTKLRHLESGVIVDRTFNAGEKLPLAPVERRPVQFLYSDGEEFHFMDTETYEQMTLDFNTVGQRVLYLKENMELEIIIYKGRPIGLELPPVVELQVVETEPGFKGDTVSGGGKPARMETGLVTKVPFFIEPGEVVRIDTRTGEYAGRV